MRSHMHKNTEKKKIALGICVIVILLSLSAVFTGIGVYNNSQNDKRAEIAVLLDWYKTEGLKKYKEMICEKVNMTDGNGIDFDATYHSEEINGQTFIITGTYHVTVYGTETVDKGFMLTGVLGESDFEMTIGD